MQKLFGIPVTEVTRPVIALLNNGVAPELEENPSWFIFDATWNSDMVPELLTQEEFIKRFDAGTQDHPQMYSLTPVK